MLVLGGCRLATPENGWTPESYARYLHSATWKFKRTQVYAAQAGLCAQCEIQLSSDFHCHHKTYERLGAEELTDLEALCPPCHRTRHRAKKPWIVATRKEFREGQTFTVSRLADSKSAKLKKPHKWNRNTPCVSRRGWALERPIEPPAESDYAPLQPQTRRQREALARSTAIRAQLDVWGEYHEGIEDPPTTARHVWERAA